MRLLLKHIAFWGTRLAVVVLIVLLVSSVYFFKVSHVQIMNLKITNPFFQYSAGLSLQTYLLLYFAIVFLLNFLILVFLTVYYQKKKRKKEKTLKKYEELIIHKLINHLVLNLDEKETASFCKKDFRKYLLKENTTPILLRVLLKVHSKINGNLKLKTTLIAKELELNKFIKIYLFSPKLKDKILALKIIAAFQFEGYNDCIMKLTSCKDSHLRTEAFITLINLSVLSDLTFLKNFKRLVSLWDINMILAITRDSGNYKIDYPGLIQSEYARVSLLGILMAGEFKKTEFKELIKNKIGSSDELLNKEAYRTFLSMVDKIPDFRFLLDRFPVENNTIKQLIISSFQKCPDKDLAIDFLMKVIEKECLSLKTEAMKILLETDTNKVHYYKNSSSDDVRKAHREAVDFHII